MVVREHSMGVPHVTTLLYTEGGGDVMTPLPHSRPTMHRTNLTPLNAETSGYLTATHFLAAEPAGHDTFTSFLQARIDNV